MGQADIRAFVLRDDVRAIRVWINTNCFSLMANEYWCWHDFERRQFSVFVSEEPFDEGYDVSFTIGGSGQRAFD